MPNFLFNYIYYVLFLDNILIKFLSRVYTEHKKILSQIKHIFFQYFHFMTVLLYKYHEFELISISLIFFLTKFISVSVRRH